MLTMSDEMKVTEKFLKIMQETGIGEKLQFISSHETETEIVSWGVEESVISIHLRKKSESTQSPNVSFLDSTKVGGWVILDQHSVMI